MQRCQHAILHTTLQFTSGQNCYSKAAPLNPFHSRFIYSHSLLQHEVTLTCLCNRDISIFFLLTWYRQHLVSRSKGVALILVPAPNSSRICQIETLGLACITLKNPCILHCSWVTRLPASSKHGVSLSEWVGWPSAAHLLRPIKNSLVSCVFGLGINRQFPQGTTFTVLIPK